MALRLILDHVLGTAHVSARCAAIHEINTVSLILEYPGAHHCIQWRRSHPLVIKYLDAPFMVNLGVLLDSERPLPQFQPIQIRRWGIFHHEPILYGLASCFREIFRQHPRRLQRLQCWRTSPLAGPRLYINGDTLSCWRIWAECIRLVYDLSRFGQRWVMSLVDWSGPKSVRIVLVLLILQHFNNFKIG